MLQFDLLKSVETVDRPDVAHGLHFAWRHCESLHLSMWSVGREKMSTVHTINSTIEQSVKFGSVSTPLSLLHCWPLTPCKHEGTLLTWMLDQRENYQLVHQNRNGFKTRPKSNTQCSAIAKCMMRDPGGQSKLH